MKDEAYQVNRTVRNVAVLESIRIVRVSLILLLIGEFFLRYFYHYATTELIFIVWLVVGPFVLGQVIKKDKTKKHSVTLPIFCKKYRYSHRELISQMIVCAVCWVYFYIQLYANVNSSIEEAFIIYLPILYIIGTPVGVIGLYIYKRRMFGYELENNQL